jgi:hypothetical protein
VRSARGTRARARARLNQRTDQRRQLDVVGGRHLKLL